MSFNTTRLIVGLITLLMNYTIFFMVFERRFGRIVSYSAPVLFTAVLYLIIFSIGLHRTGANYTGISHILVMMFIFKGRFFQKVFILFMQMMVVAAFMILAGIISGSVTQSNDGFLLLVQLIIILVLYSAYVVFLRIIGRRILKKMFVEARNAEWAFYALTAMASYFMLVLYQDKIVTKGGFVVFLFYVLWNFIILCYAIITTHEKSKQKFDAEQALEIIASGKEHYQRMNEMYDELRIMRHDYKYHMDVIGELMKTGNEGKIDQYLALLKNDLAKKEFPVFCANSVLNALVASYAERFAKLDIKFVVKIALPDTAIPNYEMCIVLGNLLQNALEACMRLENERRVEMIINTRGAHLVVMVKNNFNGEITVTDGFPVSAKNDGGLGLRSVQAVTARYDGELITEWDSSTFTVYAMLKW